MAKKLTLIETRYSGNKCVVCHREVKLKEKAYFENDNGKKKLYCKKCGEIEANIQPSTETAKAETINYNPDILEDIRDRVVILNEMYPAIEERVRDIETSINLLEVIINKLVATMTEYVSSPAKATKK